MNTKIDRSYPTIENISTGQLKELQDNGEPPVIIDVRERKEYEVSHLPGAYHISDAATVRFTKDTPIVAYCSVGIRSAEFLAELEKRGYKRLQNLRGSIFEWANKGYPLERQRQPVFSVHPFNRKWGRLLNPEKHQYQLDK